MDEEPEDLPQVFAESGRHGRRRKLGTALYTGSFLALLAAAGLLIMGQILTDGLVLIWLSIGAAGIAGLLLILGVLLGGGNSGRDETGV
jgi:hypothetical protein